MADRATLLVEIGTEELPPKALLRLADAFRDAVADGLDRAGVDRGTARHFATPRRLAVQVDQVSLAQPERLDERRGPSLSAAFDDTGKPTRAAEGFARSCGRQVEQLERLETDRGSWLVARSRVDGQATATLLPTIVEQALAALPIPKRMRWGSRDEEFVRPVHWLVMLLGDAVVPGRVLGLDAGRLSRGHRFHCPEPITIAAADSYAATLASPGHVIADFAERRCSIEQQVAQLAADLGGHALVESTLLDEVTALVEWPVALAGNFEARFLAVPPEALISTMQGNQKYFPVTGEDGALLPHFIAVSNIDSCRPETVRGGNERVIRPRFSDAEFFWNQDKKRALTDLEDKLTHVVYQEQLGSLHDRAQRIATLAEALSEAIGCRPAEARLAGRLCKCDLLTDMVGEFPELQGIMGRYYARHDGHPESVACAIAEHYLPRFAGDAVPATPTGQAVAIADRIDILVGSFGIGQRPSGDRDPFGLRRAALGLQRIVIERTLEINLATLIDLAVALYGSRLTEPDTAEAVGQFLLERLRGYYADAGFTPDLFEAVTAVRPERPLDFDRRLRAVASFRALPEAAALCAANKRIRNILRQAEGDRGDAVDTAVLLEPAERELALQLDRHAVAIEPTLASGDYQTALHRLAGLRPTVDRFFDEVMVMVDDPALRSNRLALLQRLSQLFLRVADVSRLHS